jgi:hypothetical protein
MRRQQLEIITIRAVEHVLNGQSNEDSLIEFKATWPETTKVRQLAGHANSARSEEILWIIGVDEKNHTLTSPERQDPAQWWAQMCKRFDGLVAPEMMDLVVPIGESDAVTSLLFQTDRSPLRNYGPLRGSGRTRGPNQGWHSNAKCYAARTATPSCACGLAAGPHGAGGATGCFRKIAPGEQTVEGLRNCAAVYRARNQHRDVLPRTQDVWDAKSAQ